MEERQRLTAIEASFLALERSGMPMHVAAVVMFEGAKPITLPDLRHLLASRLRRLARFRHRVDFGFGISRPQWVTVPRINYDLHLFHHYLPEPGTRGQLFDLSARIHEIPLSRERPLWEIHLIDGLAGDSQAMLLKTHHAITDGLAGVQIAEVLFDPAPGTKKPELPTMRFVTNGPSGPWPALQALEGLGFTAAAGPLASDGPFNGPVGPHRVFGASTLQLEAVRQLKRQLGASVDDVVVAVVAAGISSYLHEVNYPGIPVALKAMLPVSTRPSTRGVHLGNHVSAIFADLPMGINDLPELIHRIAASKTTLRTAHATAGSSMLIEAAGLLPAPMHTALLRFVSDLPFANLVLSDVPGPEETLHLLGRRITACYPMMPLASHLGLSIATVTLAGVMGVGVTADPGLVPDPQRIAAAIGRILPAFERAHRRAA